jgi:hypothetical protein
VGRVDLADDTFVVADPAEVARLVADPAAWARWWPELRLRVVRDRGRKGVQWRVTGPVAGSMEIWLEPALDGVVVHYYLRSKPSSPRSARWSAREARRRALRWKRQVLALKDALEAGRVPGTPRSSARVKVPGGAAEA